MAKITKIKASDSGGEKDKEEQLITRKKVVVKDKKLEKNTKKEAKKALKAEKKAKRLESGKKTFILFRPFVALGRYLRDSWQELRQVRWPNRKTTWKMVFAVLVYTLLFVLLITLLDIFFTWLFNLILGKA